MLWILRLILISVKMWKKQVHLGINEIRSVDSGRLYFAKKLMSLLNSPYEPVFLVNNTGLLNVFPCCLDYLIYSYNI